MTVTPMAQERFDLVSQAHDFARLAADMREAINLGNYYEALGFMELLRADRVTLSSALERAARQQTIQLRKA